MTAQHKTDAIAVLDANIPVVQNTVDGKYVQVLSNSPDGKHTVLMHEYVAPQGAGYIRMVSVEEVGDADLINTYRDHVGPEVYRGNGWSSYRLSEMNED